MSNYDHFDATSIYPTNDASSNYVNTSADYHTLGNYYRKTSCPFRSVPGECSITLLTPQFGGVGYSLPGFNANADSQPLSDSNYFNINQAYPQYCKRPCIPQNYGR